MQLTTVDFHGDTLIGVRDEDGKVVVPLRPIVLGLRLDWSAQFRRVQRHPILGRAVAVMATALGVGDGQEMVCLPLNRVNFWLATIEVSRIKDLDIRERVILYQEECADVLYRYFQGGGSSEEEEDGASHWPSNHPPERRSHHLTADTAVRAAAEIRQSMGIAAATEYLISHSDLIGINTRTCEIGRHRLQYMLPL